MTARAAGTTRAGASWVALVLSASVLAISAAGPLVVRAGVSAEQAALWRTALSTWMLAMAWGLGRLAWGRVGSAAAAPVGGFGAVWVRDRAAVGWAAVSGFLLALHFWAWFASLGHASIATSTLLVTMSPVWTALVSVWVPGETALRRGQWAGVLLSLTAGAVLALHGARGVGGGVETTGLGVVLATVGGLLAAGYFLASRRARRSLDLVPYGVVVNGVAALVLAGVCGSRGLGLGVPSGALGWLLLLALLPQLVGHNGIAWALRYRSTAWVSQVVLLEPVGATVLGWLWLGVVPEGLEIVCGVFIVVGLMRVMR